jgi:hypothetical protein
LRLFKGELLNPLKAKLSKQDRTDFVKKKKKLCQLPELFSQLVSNRRKGEKKKMTTWKKNFQT